MMKIKTLAFGNNYPAAILLTVLLLFSAASQAQLRDDLYYTPINSAYSWKSGWFKVNISIPDSINSVGIGRGSMYFDTTTKSAVIHDGLTWIYQRGVDSIWFTTGGGTDTMHWRALGTLNQQTMSGGGSSYIFSNGTYESGGTVKAGGVFETDSISYISNSSKVFRIQSRVSSSSLFYSDFQVERPYITSKVYGGHALTYAQHRTSGSYVEAIVYNNGAPGAYGTNSTTYSAFQASAYNGTVGRMLQVTPTSVYFSRENATFITNKFEADSSIHYVRQVYDTYDSANYTVLTLIPKQYLEDRLAGISGGGNLINGATNLGSGAQVFKDTSGNKINLRSLTAGYGITQTQGTNDIVTAINGLVVRDSVYTIDSVNAFGNSITEGQSSTHADSAYAKKYANYYGKPLVNYALSGSGAWNMIKEGHVRLGPGNSVVATVMAGFNDVRRNGDNRKTLNKVINAHKSFFVNHNLASYVPAGDASVTKYGSWSLFTANTVGGKTSTGRYTSSVNDSITYVFTDSSVVVGLIGGDGVTHVYGTFDVYIDNVLQGSYTENNQTDGVSDGVNDNGRSPMSLIYTSLGYSQHTIKLVATSTSFFVVDYLGHLKTTASANPLVIFHAPKMNATGYAIAPANATDAIIDTLNAKLDSLAATFPLDYKTFVVRTNVSYNVTTGLAVDNIHPNDVGHRQIYQQALIDARLDSVTSFTTGVIYYNTANGYFYGVGADGVQQLFGGENIYNSNGTLEGDRTITSSSYILKIIGGKELLSTDQTALALETSTTGKNSVLISLENTATNGRKYELRSLSTGVFEIADRDNTAVRFSIGTSGVVTIPNSAILSNGLQVQGALSSPAGAGFELEYTGGTTYVTSYNRAGSAWLPMIIRGSTIAISPSGTAVLTVGANALTIAEAGNLVLGTTTGTKFGTSATQKLSFFNATPIVQPTTAIAGATFVGNAGANITDTDTFDGYTLAQVVRALKNLGLLQ